MAPARSTLTLHYIWDHRRKVWHIRAEISGPTGPVLAGVRVADTTIALDAGTVQELLRLAQLDLEELLPF